MLPKSTVESVMALAMSQGTPIRPDVRGIEARRAIAYYENAPVAAAYGGGQAITYQAEDLRARMRDQHADKDIWDALPKNVVNLVRPVGDTLCTLYDDPVVYAWDETTPQGKQAKALWEQYALQSPHLAAMKDVDRLTFLGGVTAPRPLVQVRDIGNTERRVIKHAIYTQDQISYTQQPDDPAEPQQVKFDFSTGQGNASTVESHVWSDTHFIEALQNGSVKSAAYEGYANPYGVMPFEFFRNSPARGDLYGTPATDLVEAQLALNDLLTAYKDTIIVQGSGTFYTQNAPQNVKLGRRAWIDAKVPVGATFVAGYVQSNTNFTAWVEAIKLQITMTLLSRRVPESEVMARQAGDSGVALVALASSLASYRKQRISVFRPPEAALAAKTLRVVHFHCTGQLIDFPEPTIKHTELKAPMSQDTRDEIDWLRDGGYISAEEAMMRLNPGMGPEEAAEKVAANLTAKRDRVMKTLAQRPPLNVPDDDDDDEDMTGNAGAAE